MVTIKKIDCPSDKYDIKCPYEMKPEFVVIHNTANNASAKNEIAYMHRNTNTVSFHYAVDDKEIIVVEVEGDRAVVNMSENGKYSINSPIAVKNLVVVAKSATTTIKVGSTVKLNKGAKTYDGKSLSSFVYGRKHKVKELKGNRAVITYLGITVAAVNVKDLTLA